MLASIKVQKDFYADYYLAVVTILPILMVATDVLVHFAGSFAPEVEDKWPRPVFYLISFYYLWSPLVAALGIILGILALMFQDANAFYQWTTFICLVTLLAFLAFASFVYLRAFDTERQKTRHLRAKDSIRLSAPSVMRTGPWVVPRRLQIKAAYVELDFTEAVIEHDTLDLDITVRSTYSSEGFQYGNVRLITTPDITVDREQVVVEHGSNHRHGELHTDAHVILRVIVTGKAEKGIVVEVAASKNREPKPGTLTRWLRHIQGLIRWHLGDAITENIITTIMSSISALERLTTTADKLAGEDEETIRDLLLFILNSNYQGAATGETFICGGKTDILLQWRDQVAFIGECKFWNDSGNFGSAMEQLLHRPTKWRDTQVALILFVRDTAQIGNIIDKADACIESSDRLIKPLTPRESNRRRDYSVRAVNDEKHVIRLVLIPVVIPRPGAPPGTRGVSTGVRT